jgi:hypothetical protein
MKPSLRLSPTEYALLLGLVFAPDTSATPERELAITEPERELVAERLREFMGRLTRKLLGPPDCPPQPAPQRLALKNRDNDYL